MRGEKTEPLLVLDGEGTQKVVNAIPPVQARTKAAELLISIVKRLTKLLINWNLIGTNITLSKQKL